MNNTLLNRGIYFTMNALLSALALMGNISLITVCIFLAVQALTGFLFFRAPVREAPAAADLPLLLFFDVLLYAGIRYELILRGLDLSQNSAPFDNILVTGVFSAAFGLFGLLKKKRTPKWIAALFLGFGAFLSLTSLYVFQFLLYVLFVLMWMAASIVSERIDRGKAVRNNCFGVLLCALFFAVYLFEPQLFMALGNEWASVIAFAGGLLATPWQVLLIAVGLIALSLPMCPFSPGRVTVDACVLLTLASLTVVWGFAGWRLFMWSPLVAAAAVVPAIICLTRFASGKDAHGFFPVPLALGGILILYLAYDGLWLTMLAIAASAAVLRFASRKIEYYKESPVFWMLIPLCVFAVSLSWLLFKRRSVPGVLVLILITAVTLAALWVLERPHPAGLRAGFRYRAVICGLSALLCAVTLCRGGFAANIEPSAQGDTILVEIRCRDRDATIGQVSYVWTDPLGLEEGIHYKKLYLSGEHSTAATFSCQDERLVIRAADSLGVSTRIILWRRYDLDRLLFTRFYF